MQLVILIYHISGASAVSPTLLFYLSKDAVLMTSFVSQCIPVYMHVRVLVAAYLFQTGYGHLSFFWLKADFGLYRVCQVRLTLCPPQCFLQSVTVLVLQVLFRLNFLVLLLCVVMDRPYQFYYFVPLVTVWFVIIYCTLAMWPQIVQKKANSTSECLKVCMFLLVLCHCSVLCVNRQCHVALGSPAEVTGPPAAHLLLFQFPGNTRALPSAALTLVKHVDLIVGLCRACLRAPSLRGLSQRCSN